MLTPEQRDEILRLAENLSCADTDYGKYLGLERMSAYLDSITAPEGWKMMPVEPTSAMIDAGWSAQSNSVHPMLHSYRAMLAVAPQPGDSNER